MNILITDDFDLGKIAGSGQCFRWKQMDAQTWRIIAAKPKDKCGFSQSLPGTGIGRSIHRLVFDEKQIRPKEQDGGLGRG